MHVYPREEGCRPKLCSAGLNFGTYFEAGRRAARIGDTACGGEEIIYATSEKRFETSIKGRELIV